MSTRRALFYSFIDRYSGLVLSIISSMVVARLLTPADFGIFTVASALLMLASAVRDMGAGQYLVQAKSLDAEQIRSVWTIQFGMGLALAVFAALLAVPAAWFYREPRMTPVLLVMAGSFLVNPFGAITYAMLMRKMQFQQVAVMRFSANLAGAVTSVLLAYRGWGPTSLAVGAFASTLTNALVAQCFRDRSVALGFGRERLREVFSFGGRIAGTQVVNGVFSSAPDFALGRLQSVHASGIYSRSNGLVSMFSRLVTDAVYNVAVAMFSEQNRNGKPVTEGTLRALSYITVLNWTFSLHLMLLAAPVTTVLYGDQWGESVLLTRILALSSALLAPVPICIAVTTALGRADRVLGISLRAGLLTAAAALTGAAISLPVMAGCVTAASVVSSLIWIKSTCELTSCSWGSIVATLARSALVAGMSAIVPLGFVLGFGLEPAAPWPLLIASSLLGGLALVIALLMADHPLASEFRPLLQRLQRQH